MRCGVCGTDLTGKPAARDELTQMLYCVGDTWLAPQIGLIHIAECPHCGFVYSKTARFLDAGTECPACRRSLRGDVPVDFDEAGECSVCGGYQWVRFDGTCAAGHPAGAVSGRYRPGAAGATAETDEDLDCSDADAVARRMAELIKRADASWVGGADGGGPKYRALAARMRAIGERLCETGGDALMQEVARGVAAQGGRVRDCELYWNGVGGWMY